VTISVPALVHTCISLGISGIRTQTPSATWHNPELD
jgi:hypothetical protein